MPYKKQKTIRGNKKDVIYDLMTDLGLLLSFLSHTVVGLVCMT